MDNTPFQAIVKATKDASGSVSLVGPDGPFGGVSVGVDASTGNAQTDSGNLLAAIAKAGVNGVVTLPMNQTYVIDRGIRLLTGQRFNAFGSAVKVMDQIETTISAVTATGTTTAVVVASTLGLYVGQDVALDTGNLSGTQVVSNAVGTITAINGNNVQITWSGSFAAVSITLGPPYIETPLTSYAFPSGTHLVTAPRGIYSSYDAGRVAVRNLELDGNRDNATYGLRWETTALLDIRGDGSSVFDVFAHDGGSDNVVLGGVGCLHDKITSEKCGGHAMHFTAVDVSVGLQKTRVSQLSIDSPGMGTYPCGHIQSISAGVQTYSGICVSNNIDNVDVDGYSIFNTYNSARCTGIGQIDSSSNNNIALLSGRMKGMSHGAFKIGGYGAGSDIPSSITIDGLEADNCSSGLVDFVSAWDSQYSSFVGINGGTPWPRITQFTLRNANFVDCPAAIMGCDYTSKMENVSFRASAVGKSSSLHIASTGYASGTKTAITLNNVTSIRPKGNDNATNGSWQWQYRACIYTNDATIKGDTVIAIGGYGGIRAQAGTVWEASNTQVTDNYSYGFGLLSSTSEAYMNAPKVRVTDGFTVDNNYVGLDFYQSSSLTQRSRVINPDVSIRTTNASQRGIRLSQATTGAGTLVNGGSVVAKAATSGGVDGVSIGNSGASTKNAVLNTACYPAFVAGGGDQSVNNTTIANP